MIEPIKRQRGFSLAEVLVAIALLSVILLALFGLITGGMQRAYSGKKMTQATNLAQTVLERVNIYDPQKLLGLSQTDTTPADGVPDSYVSQNTPLVKTWVRTGATVTPADEGTSTEEVERNAIRALLVGADLPASTGRSATLSITATPLPEGASPAKNFSNATMVRITVDLSWYEWGNRRRQVSLQSLNLRKKP